MEESLQMEFLDPQKVRFSLSPNGFLMASRNGGDSVRVFLRYAFPLEETAGYVSLYDQDQQELGMLYKLSELSPDQRQLVEQELARRYYCPTIRKIYAIKTKLGMSVWDCGLTDRGRVTFTVKDTYKSIIRVDEHRMFVVDVDGARYEIPDADKLDKKSFHKLELYL